MTDEEGVTYQLVRLDPEGDPDASWAVLRQEMMCLHTVEFVPNDCGDGSFVIRRKATPTEDPATAKAPAPVKAPAPPPDAGLKYTTVPEGGLLRIRSAAGFSHILQEGTLGGLIESPRNLSQKGNCWINRGSTVTGQVVVNRNAVVGGDSTITGQGCITDNAKVVGSTIDGTGIDIEGDAHVSNCKLSGSGTIAGIVDRCDLVLQYDSIRRGVVLESVVFANDANRVRMILTAGQFRHAYLRNVSDILSVHTQWGTLDFYPQRIGDDLMLRATVGCQQPDDAEDLLEIAADQGMSDSRLEQLRHIIAAAAELGRSFGAVNVDRWTLPS